MARNEIPREEAVYIGDTKGDQEAAKLAGISFIHAAYGFGQVEDADAVIHEFAGLGQVLKKL